MPRLEFSQVHRYPATGGVDAFGHVVDLAVLGLKFESMVYFFADE
jgi:hypothetical protein